MLQRKLEEAVARHNKLFEEVRDLDDARKVKEQERLQILGQVQLLKELVAQENGQNNETLTPEDVLNAEASEG